MAGRQQTFDLIPTSLVRSTGPRPPMTSKAAKKAYLKAQGPRMSRAEQRRLEAEERARQKEEYEKERNAKKAKAARERKAQKEQAQRDARRKMGLPEPSKFVRPSQPTISRFVVAGNKRSWQEMEIVAEESDSTIYEHKDEDYPLAKRVPGEDISEEEYGEFPSLSQYDLPRLFDDLDTPRKLLKEDEQSSQELPRRKLGGDKEENAFNNGQIIDEMIAAQLLSEAAEASSRHDGVSPARALSNRSNNIPIFVDEEDIDCGHTTNSKETRSQAENRPVLADRPLNFPPPVKAAKAISFVPTPPKSSRFVPAAEANNPPSATQIFLENHLDDFFPSPSQEIRELLDDANELPSYTQISRELNPRQSAIKEDLVMAMFSSQDFVLSSQDLLEITTPSRGSPSRDGEAAPVRVQAPSKKKGRFFEEREEDLLHAAIHESKLGAERERKQRELLEKPSGPATRTLQRVQSAATDYGDEEFSAFEKELLALF
ncbi:hypothetical protein OIDMADRAFT_145424 [Oidiodendron maius Zn]|uniref:Uncharacterized protein n=1 Tax=Oidiodendron maius (strain Zn) TaxID=913774 RepID=A0A0C3DH53_OIDMZ|nr:hypothetical protein OIDMADRAFT_145424 [Oidiodendron maius Zn]